MGRLEEMKERYEQIAIPEELHVRVEQEIMKSRKQQEEKNNEGHKYSFKKVIRRMEAAAAGVCILFTAALNTSPVFAKEAAQLPVIGGLAQILTFRSYETEKDDILKSRNYLLEKVITEPSELLATMPEAVGPQFQGEWALYSASMLSAALTNIAKIYPETRLESIQHIDSLIKIVLSPELRQYDANRWGEDTLETLDGDISHISYLSHLAWMISGYKAVGGDGKYDKLYDDLCETMNRRILLSPNLNLQTYPGEYIYVPDMLVAIVALSNYAKQHNGKYLPTVLGWLQEMQKNWLDEKSGQIMSMIPDDVTGSIKLPAKGSYSALSCYYLTFVDDEFAREQYELLKVNFWKDGKLAGFKEYYDRKCMFGFDIDAGPILLNLSPTGTAFGLGAATYFDDKEVRKSILKTAELAGFSVAKDNQRHYLLANVALVGEAITLAMRTAIKWD